MIKGLLAVTLISLASCGYGFIWLKIVGIDRSKHFTEKLTTAFALGIGTIGWLTFWPGISGHLEIWMLILLLLPGWMGYFFILDHLKQIRINPPNHKTYLPLIGIVFVGMLELLEAMAPPADADSLAYHFALPKLFLTNGAIEFVPIAVQGAIPLLNHMLYIHAYALGGEIGLTLWAFITQGVICLAIYGVGRRWLASHWSLVLILIFLSTPAVIFSAGTGQLEVKTGLFMLIGALFAADTIKNNHWGKLAVAGLMAGFFIGSKYLGLFAAIGLLVVILIPKNRLRSFCIFSLFVLISGLQWYLWNWWHSGMPIFPTFFSIFDLNDTIYWNAEIDNLFRTFLDESLCFPRSIIGLVNYPFVATLFPASCMGVARTGLGPFLWILLPGILYGLFKGRKLWKNSVITYIAIPILVYYVLWFFIPSFQISRHLLPIYPIALLIGTVVIHRLLKNTSSTLLLSLASIITIGMGIAIHIIFSINHFQYFLQDESRDDYLYRNVSNYEIADWVNSNLSKNDRIANPIRYMNYLFEVPYLFIPHVAQTQLEFYHGASYEKFLSQIQSSNLTHMVITPSYDNWKTEKYPDTVIGKFLASEYANHLISFEGIIYHSRTLGQKKFQSSSIVEIRDITR